jgi:CheY-like chemotaxis protein
MIRERQMNATQSASGSTGDGVPPALQRRVLVVDDEPDMLVNIARILRRGPYACVTAASGEEALALLDREQPDLILTDLRMPGMDGFALLRALRRMSTPIPVIVFTAYATEATAQEAFAIGANGFLAKPFTGTQLLAVVRASLDDAGRPPSG